jgi:TetR/AcrR family transcriptional repressor of nem operon
MRYSKEHKQETHARIVKKASVRLREKGAHGIGVADLMKDAGLTHGGFYAHFDSREALVIEAFGYAMDRSIAHWRKKAEQTPIDKRLAAVVDSYLTPSHRDDPGHGCAIPALSAEIARENPKTRKAFAAKLEQMIEMIAEQIPDVARKTARKQAMASLATMMGTLVLARVAGSGELSDEILGAGREAVLERAAAGKTDSGYDIGRRPENATCQVSLRKRHKRFSRSYTDSPLSVTPGLRPKYSSAPGVRYLPIDIALTRRFLTAGRPCIDTNNSIAKSNFRQKSCLRALGIPCASSVGHSSVPDTGNLLCRTVVISDSSVFTDQVFLAASACATAKSRAE